MEGKIICYQAHSVVFISEAVYLWHRVTSHATERDFVNLKMAGYYWTCFSANQSHAPPNAVVGGRDSDGSVIYVGSANYNGDKLPAKVIPKKKYAAVSWGGNEISIKTCQILCESAYTWQTASNGYVPSGAVPGGRTSNGETLYIAKAYHKKSTTVGKLHPSHQKCYIPFGGYEHGYSTYEVLCMSNGTSHNWQHFNIHSYSCAPNAVQGGVDADGSIIYVGRAYHNGDQLPCKVIPSKKYAAVSWGGKEISVQNCEVLCQSKLEWVPSCNGSVPFNAVSTGRASNGETMYVGRAHHNGSLTVGKIHPSHRTCYIPYGGKEHSCPHYEVLIS